VGGDEFGVHRDAGVDGNRCSRCSLLHSTRSRTNGMASLDCSFSRPAARPHRPNAWRPWGGTVQDQATGSDRRSVGRIPVVPRTKIFATAEASAALGPICHGLGQSIRVTSGHFCERFHGYLGSCGYPLAISPRACALGRLLLQVAASYSVLCACPPGWLSHFTVQPIADTDTGRHRLCSNSSKRNL